MEAISRLITSIRQAALNNMNDYDKDKVDEMVLALMYLTLHDEYRAWKGFDWDALNRLFEKGMIYNPVGKAKSVMLTDAGLARSEALFKQHFGK
jgi:hypothetical protein